jgi:hypothetical protein
MEHGAPASEHDGIRVLPLAAVSTLLTLSIIKAPTVRILNEHHLLDNGADKTITITPSSRYTYMRYHAMPKYHNDYSYLLIFPSVGAATMMNKKLLCITQKDTADHHHHDALVHPQKSILLAIITRLSCLLYNRY